MRERGKLVEGDFEVYSELDSGTEVLPKMAFAVA